jgi:hypothetical protein
MLATNIVTKEDVLGQRRRLITVGSRARNQIAGVFGSGELPVPQRADPLAVLYMQDAHEKDITAYSQRFTDREKIYGLYMADP